MSKEIKEIEVTINYEFLEDLPDGVRNAILEGSTRSTKTYSVCQFFVAKCTEEPGTTVRCFRHNGVTHNKTTIADFKEIMTTLGIWDEGSWNGTDKVFAFNNGSIFAFEATSEVLKLHGCKQDYAWLNEVMEITQDAYAQIDFRTTKIIVMDFNPSFNHHWVFTSVINLPNTAYIHSTFEDNPFLTQAQIDSIKSYDPSVPANVKNNTADQWHWDVYGLGKRGKIEGAIFKLFELTDFFPKREICQRWGMGLDFGFSLDPAALIECALFQDELYLREWIYDRELITTTNLTRPNEPSLEGRMKEVGVDMNVKVYADCAEPKSIADLQLSGFNVIPCVKGKDSIIHGIDLLKQRKLFVHKSSQNLQLELEHYRWKKGKTTGEYMGAPEDKNNHLIDAARYWALAELQQQKYEHVRGARGNTRKVQVKSTFNSRGRGGKRR